MYQVEWQVDPFHHPVPKDPSSWKGMYDAYPFKQVSLLLWRKTLKAVHQPRNSNFGWIVSNLAFKGSSIKYGPVGAINILTAGHAVFVGGGTAQSGRPVKQETTEKLSLAI